MMENASIFNRPIRFNGNSNLVGQILLIWMNNRTDNLIKVTILSVFVFCGDHTHNTSCHTNWLKEHISKEAFVCYSSTGC